MPRRTFDQELQRLQDEVLALGSMVEEALVQSVADLKNRDFAGSRRLVAADRTINQKRYAIEGEAIDYPSFASLAIMTFSWSHRLRKIMKRGNSTAEVMLPMPISNKS